MKFQVITIFPKIFDSYFNESIIKRAQEKNLIKIIVHDLRKWTQDKHNTVDDRPFGGGAGMVMKVAPIVNALKEIRAKKGSKNKKIILLSAKGRTWNQQLANKYLKLNEIILICGRYEGIDERVKNFIDEEISVGDFVLTGGELPAMVIIDSLTRLLPGVLGNAQSALDESHSIEKVLEYPHYSRPEIFDHSGKKYRVPKVLLSGDHKKINEWRRMKKRMKKT